ncbi:MAG: ABC transporter ATP-binding protein [Lachnospiraceae bacterium]|nr:ABC transporter ATP-binding protein [Lachnospiraceae bacterium]
MNKTESKTKRIWRQMRIFLAPYKAGLIGAVIMIFIANACMAAAPSIEGSITSQIVSDVQRIQEKVPGAAIQFQRILEIILLLLIVYIVKTLTQIGSVFLLTNAIQNTMHDVRNAVQDKIRRLPVRYFDTNTFGDVLSKVTNDIDTVSNALQQSFAEVIRGVLSLVFAFAMMFYINVTMACIALVLIPLCLLITRAVVRRSQDKFKKQQDALGALNGTITEMYTGYNELLLYNRQKKAVKQFRKVNEELQKQAFRANFMSSVISPCVSLVTYLTIGVLAVLGSIFVIQGKIKVGNLQAFIRYIWQVNDPLSQVSNLSTQIQSAFAALERICEMLEAEEEVKEADPAKSVDHVTGQVTFEHVQFGYGQENIIRDLNIEVKKGQMVAIVGPTGAGKTTIINLLMRFYDVRSGAIKIDGVDIRDMKREDLRSLFGMVLQDTWLFTGSIYDNIRYGRQEARKDEVIDAAKMANVHHFIRTLPEGYQTMINEEGSNISQGEKQLLTIARAILKNPQILILDEATSSVDTRLEKMIQDAMHRVMDGRTSFVIAHRLSTIRSADLILVLDGGDIVEQGTHEELLAKKGYYEKLYHSQFAVS